MFTKPRQDGKPFTVSHHSDHEISWHKYINLNLIANREGLWPLEFTSRFGYPRFALCETLHDKGWDRIFKKMLDRHTKRIDI